MGLTVGLVSKADFCLCNEAVVLILKMASVSPSCELDDQAHLRLIRGCGFDT